MVLLRSLETRHWPESWSDRNMKIPLNTMGSRKERILLKNATSNDFPFMISCTLPSCEISAGPNHLCLVCVCVCMILQAACIVRAVPAYLVIGVSSQGIRDHVTNHPAGGGKLYHHPWPAAHDHFI